MKNKIKWVLFDLTGVISTWSFRSKKWKIINNKKYKERDFETIYFESNYSAYERGKIQHKEFVESYLLKNNDVFTLDEFVEIFKRSVTPVRGIENILKKLKKNYKLAILSNEGIEWGNYKLDKSGLKRYFDKIIISSQIGFAKPDLKFYKKSLKLLNIEPKSCVFIDDLEENINAAEKLGIKSILFKNPHQLQKDLNKYLD
jgi:putative hydrolase of the HAD superfamily